MSERYIAFNANGDDDSCVDFMAKVDNGKITEVLDFAEENPHNMLKKMNKDKGIKGMFVKELADKLVKHFHYATEYTPFSKVENISKEVYEAGKAQLAEKKAEIARLLKIEKRRDEVLAQKAKLDEKIGNRVDKLELKQNILNSASQTFSHREIKNGHVESDEEAKISNRIYAAKKFMKESHRRSEISTR